MAESSPITQTPGADVGSSQPHEDAAHAVERVAEAFDYSVTRRERVYVLKKRYRNKADIPDLTVGEALDALETVSHNLQSFEPHYPQTSGPWSAQNAAIANVLSREQIAALEHGGVPVSSLNADQRSDVWRFAVSFYIGDVSKQASAAADLMRSIMRQSPKFRWGQILGGQAQASSDEFGFEAHFGKPDHAVFMPISNPFSVHANLDGSITRIGPLTVNGIQNEQIDPTEPPRAGDGMAGGKQTTDIATTIADVVKALNSRTTERIKCDVDVSFERKDVTYAGLDNASTSRVTLALAEVYGLEARHKYDGTITITRPTSRAVTDVAAIGEALMTAIPSNIRRYMKARLDPSQSTHPELAALRPTNKTSYQRAATDGYIEALRLVRAEAQPAVLASKDKSVALSLLSTRCNHAFALSQSIRQFAVALWMAERQPPPYIADFDNIILTGGLQPDNLGSRFSLSLSYKDKVTGEMYQGVGVYNALVPAR